MSGFDPQRVFAALAGAGADYVAVGGVAVIAHGVVRATVDVDIVPSPDTLDALARALGELGARPHGEPATPVDARLLDREANMRLDTQAGPVDLLLDATYRRVFGDLRRRAVTVDLDGTPVIVAARNDLVRLKAATGRDRDLLDIGDLLALDEEAGA